MELRPTTETYVPIPSIRNAEKRTKIAKDIYFPLKKYATDASTNINFTSYRF
jgi:hypothetical protein